MFFFNVNYLWNEKLPCLRHILSIAASIFTEFATLLENHVCTKQINLQR